MCFGRSKILRVREARDIKVMITQEGTRAVVKNRNGEEFIAIDTGEITIE